MKNSPPIPAEQRCLRPKTSLVFRHTFNTIQSFNERIWRNTAYFSKIVVVFHMGFSVMS